MMMNIKKHSLSIFMCRTPIHQRPFSSLPEHPPPPHTHMQTHPSAPSWLFCGGTKLVPFLHEHVLCVFIVISIPFFKNDSILIGGVLCSFIHFVINQDGHMNRKVSETLQPCLVSGDVSTLDRTREPKLNVVIAECWLLHSELETKNTPGQISNNAGHMYVLVKRWNWYRTRCTATFQSCKKSCKAVNREQRVHTPLSVIGHYDVF